MQVKHVSAYLDEDVFEGMEELRRSSRRRARSLAESGQEDTHEIV